MPDLWTLAFLFRGVIAAAGDTMPPGRVRGARPNHADRLHARSLHQCAGTALEQSTPVTNEQSN